MRQFLMEIKDTLLFTMVNNLRSCVGQKHQQGSSLMTTKRVSLLANFHWIKVRIVQSVPVVEPQLS